MIRIRNHADLRRLHTAAVSRALAAAVETHFEELRDAFDVSPLDCEFVLDSGHLVVLEATDDEDSILRYLSAGFQEWGELDNSVEPPILKFVVMFDNDYLDTVFTEAGLYPIVEKWIEPYIEV